jgi:hypothetical protein
MLSSTMQLKASHCGTLNEILGKNVDNEGEIIRSLFGKCYILVVAQHKCGKMF